MSFGNGKLAALVIWTAWSGLAATWCHAADESQGARGVAAVAEVPEGHPRVYVQAADLPELRERIQHAPYNEIWEGIRRSKDYLNRALVFLVEGDRAAGREAIASALKDLHKPDVFADTRHFDSAYHKSACVYDWCYPLLTDEEKQQFIHQFVTIPNQENAHGGIYIGYPARMTSNAATGHQCEGYLLASQIPAGIAVYDENQVLYDAAARLFFEKFVPVRRFHYDSHTHHQGTFYGVGRFHYDVNASWLFRAMGAGDVLSRRQRFVPYYYLYMRQPDGVAFPVGDAIAGGSPEEVYAKVGSYYHDPYLLGLAGERTRGDFGPLFDLLFRDYETDPRSIGELPLTKYFPSPCGAMVVRTGWDIGPGSRDAVAYMHIGEVYFGNHQHFDFGTFQLAYRGLLAMVSGYYDDYGGEHNRNYYNSTISKNGLLIFDSHDEIRFQNAAVANDGGETPQPENLMTEQPVCRMGRVLSHAFGPDSLRPQFNYLSGDITAAYGRKRAELVTRSMVTFRLDGSPYPLAMVVFDRVKSTDPALRKAWLLHSTQEPRIDGRAVTIVRDGPNPGTRATRMPEDATFGGRLVAECLLPEKAVMTKVGGPGREFWIESANRNFPPEIKRSKGLAFDPGAWRVEVSPSNRAQDDRFLHVLSVMDADTERGPEVRLLRSGPVVGAMVHDRAVLFAKNTTRVAEFAFELPVTPAVADGRSLGVLICDLHTGLYTLERDGRPIARPVGTTWDEGCVYFQVPPGRYQLRQVSNSMPYLPEKTFWERLEDDDR